ncbi:hypothetical protein [Chryseobacterium caseinilyticum]|uniref:SDR family oxidoreductase n=1 Tax=Chryseobacterium caseinilyticum TaxID=2771428 RepID=A0ABR8Z6S7_9FLAO|nr:hypothetical protein [Chryseobacterium caseinilyticum]MBD8081002.1 hypothetical protein [Chryseobacterium caseinilyticum]
MVISSWSSIPFSWMLSTRLAASERTKKVISEVLIAYGKLDILVNNLGSSSTPAGVT